MILHTIVKLSSSVLIIAILLMSLETVGFSEGIATPQRSITLPTDPFSFQSGAGQEIANSYCIICHSADYIYMQPKHSQKKWQAIITKMKHVFGCPIPQDQIPALSIYLFHQNSVSTSLSTNSR